jgi:S-adenosylmethionine:tRNA ribosyltransferase-isomerase
MEISKSDFNYHLPESHIAKYPLKQRDTSKLLLYKNGQIQHHIFSDITELLPPDAHLVLNNAKVIPARMFFRRKSGAKIEVLLLEPHTPSNYDEVFKATTSTIWKAMVGNSKKWNEAEEVFLSIGSLEIKARWFDKSNMLVEIIHFSNLPFSQLLEKTGNLPLPPYLKRANKIEDAENYQTVMAKKDGSVAAPTAGLHFTEDLLKKLRQKGVPQTELTLHVGAGTFLPLKNDDPTKHPMHREQFEISIDAIKKLMAKPKIIAVGTTSLRVLESLYWLGMDCAQNKMDYFVSKLKPYENEASMSYQEALSNLIVFLENAQQTKLIAHTEILILPHYQIQSIQGLITNFHLPESTLLMLVAAIVKDDWKKIYETAIQENYRFLSFGDGSLLLRS